MKHVIVKAFTIITIFVIGISQQSQAQIYSTIDNGDWNDPAIWDLGTIPSANDSIEIFHEVTLTGNRSIGTIGVIRVNVLGSLNFDQLTNLNRFYNEGIIAGDELVNDPGAVYRNLGFAQVNKFTERPDGRTFNAGTLKVVDILENRGTLVNQDLIIAQTQFNNADTLRLLDKGVVLALGFRNNPTGIMYLCGQVAMGTSPNDPGVVTAGIPVFTNDGKIIGCEGGVYAGEDGTLVTDNGEVQASAYLCAGPNTNYVNSPSSIGDFILNCCFLLEADAGPDKPSCISETTTIGGFPSAFNGTEPYVYSWTSDNATTIPNPNAENPVVSPTGETTFTLTVQDGAGCSAQDQVTITPTNDVIARAGRPDAICEGDGITLGGSPSAQCGVIGYTYSWLPITGLDDPSSPNPIASPIETTRYILTVTDGASAVAKDTTIVFVDPRPADANAGPDQEICDLATFVSGNTPTFGVGRWVVESGTASLADRFSPSTDVFDLIRGETAVLRWELFSGECVTEDRVEITVLALPSIADAGLDQELCNATSATLSAVDPEFGEGQWTVVTGTGNITAANLNNPNAEITNLVPGETVTLEWTVSQPGCTGSSSDLVEIVNHELPTEAFAGVDQVLCNNETTANLEGNTVSIGVGRWVQVSGNATITDPLLNNTTITGLTTGETYTFSWQITNESCAISEDEMIIEVLSTPEVAVEVGEICDGESVDLEASGGSQFAWSPATGLSDATIANPTAMPEVSTIYTVTISNPGCPPVNLTVDVTVHPTPVLTISNDTTILAGEEVQLSVNGADIYRWSPIESLDDPDIADPIASPATTTTYSVEGENGFGCLAEENVTITVDDRYEVFVPQMFTPNNDGNNDLLMVNTIGVETLTFKIYDRHGKLIFETSDPEIGWDGKINGTVQNIDTYVYTVTGKTFGNTEIMEKGTFQLVR